MDDWSDENMDYWSGRQWEIYNLYFYKKGHPYSDKIDFAFEQAETELNSLVKNRHIIQKKSNDLTTLSLSFLAVFLGFLYFIMTEKKLLALNLEQYKECIIVVYFLISITVIVAVSMLLSVSFVKGYYPVGGRPKDILKKNNEKLSAYQLKVLEVIHYEDCISHNRKINNDNAVKLKRSYYLIYVCILLTAFLSSIAFLFTVDWGCGVSC